jgi:hypothetical protein
MILSQEKITELAILLLKNSSCKEEAIQKALDHAAQNPNNPDWREGWLSIAAFVQDLP